MLTDRKSSLHQHYIRNKIFQFVIIVEDQALMVNLYKNSVEKILDTGNISKDDTIDAYGYELNILHYEDKPQSYIMDGKMYGVNGYMKDIICEKLNATCILHTRELKAFRDLTTFYSGHFDIQLNLHAYYRKPMLHNQRVTLLYPTEIKSVCAIIGRNTLSNIDTDSLIRMNTALKYLCVTLVFIGILWYFLLRKTDNPIKIIEVFFNMLQILLLIPIWRKVNLKIEKFMVFLLFLSNIIIFESFKTSYVAQWIKPSQCKNEINSISKLNSSNLTIFAFPTAYDWLNETYSEDTIFMNRFVRGGDNPYSYVHLDKSTNLGFLLRGNEVKSFIKGFLNEYFYAKITFDLIDCMAYSPASYPIAHFFPFKEEVNRYLMYIREAGLEKSWKMENNFNLRIQRLKDIRKSEKGQNAIYLDVHEGFTYESLVLVLRVIVVLYCLAFLVFLLEISFHSIKKCKRAIVLSWRRYKQKRTYK